MRSLIYQSPVSRRCLPNDIKAIGQLLDKPVSIINKLTQALENVKNMNGVSLK